MHEFTDKQSNEKVTLLKTEQADEPCFLISLETVNRDGLFDCYRDYLVFMSLVRDAVRANQFNVYGFCWLKDKALLLIKPVDHDLGGALLRLLKRYHFWLLQRGPDTTEYRLQMLKLKTSSEVLDSLRFLHQQAVNSKVVNDAMDYHWHSHHVYNGFWSVNWLEIGFIMEKFAGNRLVAMNRFRQYMLHQHRFDFEQLLLSHDCSKQYLDGPQSPSVNRQSVAEINSHYHQSLSSRTSIHCQATEQGYIICIRVNEYQVTLGEIIK